MHDLVCWKLLIYWGKNGQPNFWSLLPFLQTLPPLFRFRRVIAHRRLNMKNHSYFRHFNPFYMEKKHKGQKALTLSHLVTTEARQARATPGINISQRVREKKPKQVSCLNTWDIGVGRRVSRRHNLKSGVNWQKKFFRHIFINLHSYLWLNSWSSFWGKVISAVWVYIQFLFYCLMGNCMI